MPVLVSQRSICNMIMNKTKKVNISTILAEWVSDPQDWKSVSSTIPTSVPKSSRTRHLSASTVASVNDENEKLKPLLDLIDSCYAGQKSLQRSPTVSLIIISRKYRGDYNRLLFKSLKHT